MKSNTTKIIEVPFIASPMPTVTWDFNGGKFSDSRRITEQTIRGMTALTISRAERQDGGEYSLCIKNKLGKTNLTIKVLVLGK
jgi:hypothetical protein